MDPHERATSCWYRVARLISREQKDLAVEIIEGEIRSALHEVLLEAERLVVAPSVRGVSRGRSASMRSGRSGRRSSVSIPSRFLSQRRRASSGGLEFAPALRGGSIQNDLFLTC
jgi:hypothetical protein